MAAARCSKGYPYPLAYLLACLLTYYFCIDSNHVYPIPFVL
jgi:hypothetical protein